MILTVSAREKRRSFLHFRYWNLWDLGVSYEGSSAHVFDWLISEHRYLFVAHPWGEFV